MAKTKKKVIRKKKSPQPSAVRSQRVVPGQPSAESNLLTIVPNLFSDSGKRRGRPDA
jgi:hypothetical protein